MHLHLKNPLAIFDLETTGINVSHDRIVEIAIIKIMPNGDKEEEKHLLNPTIPISAEASSVHGIYDKDVENAPTFKSVAKSLDKFLEGADLGGFNILRFDIPLLMEEFLRAEINFEIKNRKLVDAQKIFHMMEKRTLSAAYRFYCDKNLEDAHSAVADTKATLEVIDAQVKRYEGEEVRDLKGNKLGVIENNMTSLNELSMNNLVDLAGRISRNDKGVEVFNFGKHKGKTVEEIFTREPSYYDWMMKGDFPQDTKRRITEIKLRGFNSK